MMKIARTMIYTNVVLKSECLYIVHIDRYLEERFGSKNFIDFMAR